MDYKVLTPDMRAKALQSRIGALEADHWGHQMNLDGLAAQPDSPEKTKAIEAAESMQAQIEAVHEVAVAELLVLDPESKPAEDELLE